MFNVIFVILHYQNIDDTINCINSIKKLQGLYSLAFLNAILLAFEKP